MCVRDHLSCVGGLLPSICRSSLLASSRFLKGPTTSAGEKKKKKVSSRPLCILFFFSFYIQFSHVTIRAHCFGGLSFSLCFSRSQAEDFIFRFSISIICCGKMFVAVYSLPVEDQKKGFLPYTSKFIFQENCKKIKIKIKSS